MPFARARAIWRAQSAAPRWPCLRQAHCPVALAPRPKRQEITSPPTAVRSEMRSAVLRRSAAAFGVRRLHAAGTAWGLANPSRSVHDGGMAGADGRRKTGDRSGAMGEDDDQSLMGAIAQGDE